MLASVFGEPALVPFHPSPQRKQGNSGRQHLPRRSAWQDAMRSTSKLRLPRKNRTMRCFS